MINPIFQAILQSPNARDFLEWYNTKYNNLNIFKDLSFDCQMGVLLSYLEIRWGFSIIADNTGYIAYYTSFYGDNQNGALLKDRFKTNNFYHIHSYEGETKDVISYYALGIIKLFNNLDIPF